MTAPPDADGLTLEPIETLGAIRDEWSALAAAAGNVFATWEWNSLWWRHFGDGRELLALACRDGRGTLVGILPMYLAARRPVPLIRFLGSEQGDRLGPICAPEARSCVAEALRRALHSRFRRGLLIGEQLPAEEGWAGLLGAHTLVSEPSPVLGLEAGTWDEFLMSQSTSLRKKIRYEERRLARDHALDYRLIDEAAELPTALDGLFSLHGARWGEQGTEAFAGAQAFHRDFAASALERGWLRLWLLEVDGRPAAAWHGFRFGGADWHYQSGRDPNWDRRSVGAVLLARTIRDCIESGLREYRFLRGGEGYKLRFANADPGLETIAIPRGVTGLAALATARAARRAPAGARKRVRSAFG